MISDAERKFVIGIDGGTQSSKVSIFNLRGALICKAVQPLRAIEPTSQGTLVHPGDDVWESIALACRNVMQKFPYDTDDILGVGLCTIRCCRALLDHRGLLTMPVISWMDPSLSKPYQHCDQNVAYVTTTSGYVGHRLTGEFKDTSANYEGMWPIDKKTWQWSRDEEVTAHYKVPQEMLFDLVKPGEILGLVTNTAAGVTGLPKGLPIVATANDKAVEALGSGLDQKSSVLISLGTYIGAMAYGNFDRPEAKTYFHNMSCIPHRYLHESGGVRQGMGIISWFRDLLGGSTKSDSSEHVFVNEQQLNQEAVDIPIGCDGLLTLPEWLAPNDRAFKRGSIIGFNAFHTRAHIYRSILESIVMTMKNSIDKMCQETDLVPEKLLISGGGANSRVFMQIFADVFDLPVHTNQITGAAGLGAAICACVGTNAVGSFDQAVENMVTLGATFKPDRHGTERYAELNTIFQQVSEQTDVINQALYIKGFQS